MRWTDREIIGIPNKDCDEGTGTVRKDKIKDHISGVFFHITPHNRYSGMMV